MLCGGKPQQRGGLTVVDPQNVGVHALQKAADLLQPPMAGSYTHRVQHHGHTTAVGRFARESGGGELGFIGGAGVQHHGGGQGGNLGHLLRGLGHDGACPHRQRQIGAVICRNYVGNTVQQRLAAADGSACLLTGHDILLQRARLACIFFSAPFFSSAMSTTPAMMEPPTVDTKNGTT